MKINPRLFLLVPVVLAAGVAGTVLRAEPHSGPEASASAAPWADVSPEQLAQWRELAIGGKNVSVVKLRKNGDVRIVLFPENNVMAPASAVCGHAAFRFGSAEEAHDFLQSVGAGVRLFDGSRGLMDDAGILEAFSDAERSILCLDDLLPDERDLAKLKATGARKVREPLFDWITQGALYSVGRGADRGYHYRAADGRFWNLTGDPVKVVALVNAEIGDVRRMDELVRNRLPRILLRFWGKPNAVVMTDPYLKRRAEAWRARLTPLVEMPAGEVLRSRYEADERLLAKYSVDGPLVMIDGNRWSLAMPILNPDGGIERWELDGSVSHFAIATMRRMPVEPVGSITFVATESDF